MNRLDLITTRWGRCQSCRGETLLHRVKGQFVCPDCEGET